MAAELIEDLDVFVVVLAERADGSGMRLEMQRALEFDDQDRSLGMDTYCLCRETGATHYGGVLRWRLSRRRLELFLDLQAGQILEAGNGFTIDVRLSERELSDLRNGIRRVFGDESEEEAAAR